MVDVRQLLVSNETGAGGKFIKDLATLTVADFIDYYKNSQHYFDQIIKDYQALKLHKDRQPEKYSIKEETEVVGFLTADKSTRHDKARVEIGKIADYLNGFAEIIGLYQSLVSSNTSLFGSNWSLEVYVQRTFALFAKEVSEDIQKKVMEDIVKYLDKSLHIVGWHSRRD